MSTKVIGSNVPGPPVRKAELERLSAFRHRLRRFLRFSETLCARHAVTSLQYQLLLHVMGFPGREWATVGELAERLQAKHHWVVALLDRCERLDLLERRIGRHDQRVVEVHLRPAGRRVLQSVAAGHRDELRRLQAAFGAEPPEPEAMGKAVASPGNSARATGDQT
jgi:DNA-binding MarR family transcriptional regulator